ncbi:MAG: hypothetical protein AB1894_22090 [Chloroflexota bacterium]
MRKPPRFDHIPGLWKALAIGLLAVFVGGVSLMLARISSGALNFSGLASFVSISLLTSAVVLGIWWLLRSEQPPRWLGWLLVIAVVLRLGAGVLWFVAAPIWGHGSPAEQGGYIMGDASERDQAAWRLARSGKPLWVAFQPDARGYRAADQYGGLLFISAVVYRYLGGPAHLPLLMVIITAAFSSLAVLFTWAFSRRIWGERVAWLAAWLLALYPEAILLGSSQMREAFTVTLTVVSFYGLSKYHQERTLRNLAWVFLPLLLYLTFSPPFAALLMLMLALAALSLFGSQLKDLMRLRWFWLAIITLVAFGLLGSWLTLNQLAPRQMSNPLELLSWWLRRSAELQAGMSKHASGWLQLILKNTPEWSHLLILMAYGVMQPFLPAALIVGSQAPLWPPIVMWRSLGWTLLLGMLIYAPTLALRRKSAERSRSFTNMISALIWIGILVAAFRSGGDMWDNPRYRTAFAGLQVALVAWAWLEQRRAPDPWLRRAIISLCTILAWFIPWYLRRYTSFAWPVVDLFKTLGLGVATAFLFMLWDWNRSMTGARLITKQDNLQSETDG